jgi:chitinase
LNFANQSNGCRAIPGSSLVYCPSLEEDIKTCQNVYGKTIILSIGGATYSEGGFSSAAEAVANANNVWSWFGPNTANPVRPFGSAVIDGFDFDFESSVNNVMPFVQQLRLLADQTGKKYVFTAAPQCPYPDAAVGPVLASSVAMDAVYVQFYNNYCGVSKFVPGSPNQPVFNFDVWDAWAAASANPNVKVLLGVPGNVGGAGAGSYVPADTVAAAIKYAKTFPSFGGVMVWDVSQAYGNPGFLSTIKTTLQELSGPVPVKPSPQLPAPSSSTAQVEPVFSSSSAAIPTPSTSTVTVRVSLVSEAPTTITSTSSTNSLSRFEPTPSASPPEVYIPETQAAVSTPIESLFLPTTIQTVVVPVLSSIAETYVQSMFSDCPADDLPAPTSYTPRPSIVISQAPNVISQSIAISKASDGISQSAPSNPKWPSGNPVSSQAPAVTSQPAQPQPTVVITPTLVMEWGQCGGIGYTGPTQCAEGLICKMGGSQWWYSCKKPGYPWKA